jgi:hypothetical protein
MAELLARLAVMTELDTGALARYVVIWRRWLEDDLTLEYRYTRQDGRRIKLAQREVSHLVGLTLDGVHGVSVIAYARETIGCRWQWKTTAPSPSAMAPASAGC